MRGTIAIKTTMQMEIACGYPLFLIMFEVTSSRTLSPNIKNPATAIRASRRYCLAVKQRPTTGEVFYLLRRYMCNLSLLCTSLDAAYLCRCWERRYAHPTGLESVSRASKTPDTQSNLPINRPKLNGNVDHRCGNKDVGAGSRSEPGE